MDHSETRTVRLICSGRRTHKDTLIATLTDAGDHWEILRSRGSRQDQSREKQHLSCRRCTREWVLRNDKIEASLRAALARGVSRVDLSRVS